MILQSITVDSTLFKYFGNNDLKKIYTVNGELPWPNNTNSSSVTDNIKPLENKEILNLTTFPNQNTGKSTNYMSYQ